MNAAELQISFLKQIKNQLPPHLSLVDTIADQLNISADSTYRRIRGEKSLTFEEILTLCSKFNISFDQFISLKGNTYNFNGILPTDVGYTFDNWLESMLNFLKFINSFQRKHFYWFVRDFPVFIHFQVPELLAFKFFFWSKSILGNSNFENARFSIQNIDLDERNIKTEGNKSIIQHYTLY